MIRILYVADSLMAGGIESQLVELVTRLDRTRFELHILCLYGPTSRSLHFAPQIRAANIPVYTPDLGWSAWDKVKGMASIITTAWRVRPQIIQAEGYHANLLTRLVFPCIFFTKLIGSVRGIPTAKQLLYERLSHWLCRRIVVNAPHLKQMLEAKAGVPANKVIYIPNGITLQHYAQPHDRDWRQHHAPGVRRVFVTLGRISFEKNIHWTVEGLGVLKQQGQLPDDVRFFVVGPVHHPEAKIVLDETINRYGLNTVVIQHPQTSYPEDYYHACDVSILYSPAEGLPNVCIESLAAGRPVIISEDANAAGVIDHETTGWVVPTHNQGRLAETLHRAITMSDAELEAMRDACLEHARQYTVEALVQRYTSLYETWSRHTSPSRSHQGISIQEREAS